MYLGIVDDVAIDEDYFFNIGVVINELLWYWIFVLSVDGVNSDDV